MIQVTKELQALVAPLGIVWLLLIGAMVRALWKREWKALLFFGALVGLLNGVSSTQIPARLLAGLETPYVDSTRQIPQQVDAVVMLGGTHGFTRRGFLPLNLAEASDRILTAVELIRRGCATNLVLGGGGYENEGQRHPDSELVETWLRLWRAPIGQLHLLGWSADTHDEAQRAAALAAQRNWKKVILVTTASHLRRGEAVFRRAGLDVIPVGCDFRGLDTLDAPFQLRIVPTTEGFDLLDLWLHEVIGWWYYRLKGWL